MSRLRLGRSSGLQVTSGLQRSVTSLDAFSPRTPNAPAPGDRECRECRECRDSRLFVVVSVDVVVVADPGDPASMVSCLAGVEDHDHLPDFEGPRGSRRTARRRDVFDGRRRGSRCWRLVSRVGL